MEALYKGIHQGDPGTAKTGALAALVNDGYRIILADFDGNPEPLLVHCASEARARVTVVPFGDELEAGSDGAIKRKNTVSSLRQFNRFLHTGSEAAGKPADWDSRAILVWDSLTSTCVDAERLALELNNNVTRDGAHIGVLGREIEATLGMFCSNRLRCHRVLICHLKLIAPRVESSYGGETPLQKQVKQEIGALMETAYHPNMPGAMVARNLAHSFNTALLFELSPTGARIIRTQPIKGYTIKCPVEVKDKLPIETGLLTIFKAFGEALR